jgi:hypothetical protein
MSGWSVTEIRILTENYNKVTNDVLADLMPHRTPLAIYKKAYSIGLRKDADIEFANRSIANKGCKCNFWNGGTTKSTKGYKLIRLPDHHRADSKGYVLEHILVFEEAMGVKVPEGCCIHHINGIKDDNRIENLCMMTNSAHTAFHNRTRRRKK